MGSRVAAAALIVIMLLSVSTGAGLAYGEIPPHVDPSTIQPEYDLIPLLQLYITILELSLIHI